MTVWMMEEEREKGGKNFSPEDQSEVFKHAWAS
jgi:hypothetical protein